MRQKLISNISRALLSVVIVVTAAIYPLNMVVRAEEASPVTDTPSTTVTAPVEATPVPVIETPPTVIADPVVAAVEPVPVVTGPTQPTGADANKYVFNEATGLWENDFYTWNPVTKQTAPKTPQTYSYNPVSGKWETTQWQYDTTSGTYQPNVTDVTAPPAGALIAPESRAAISDTGPDSTSTVDNTSKSSGTFDLFYNAQISNNILSSAQSGNVTAARNTLVGNAASGDATAIANIINLLQSSWSPIGDNTFSTFVANIEGDVFGDLYVNPVAGPQSQAKVSNDPQNNLTLNVDNTARMDNTINLAAGSGDANVYRNTTAGDATTGDARAIANVINVLNSSIVAGQSFLGVINIEGSLIGDILLPQNILNNLLASSGPSSANTLSTGNDSNTNANFTDNQAITNNVVTAANSGAATISRNTNAGSALSGNAMTNVTLLNLTGRQIIGDNALLVFVNVLGHWTGLIMDAPAGSTAAAIGGGISENNLAGSQNTDINVTNDSQINNNINVAARSGDANISENTSAGNARTGNASASVNIANVSNSQLSLANWFGILFINVLGNWQGSFGVNTAAGNPTTQPPVASNGASTPAPQVFQFVPAGNTDKNTRFAIQNNSDSDTSAPHKKTVVLASTDIPNKPVVQSRAKPKKSTINWLPASFGGLAAFGLLGIERVKSRRDKTLKA